MIRSKLNIQALTNHGSAPYAKQLTQKMQTSTNIYCERTRSQNAYCIVNAALQMIMLDQLENICITAMVVLQRNIEMFPMQILHEKVKNFRWKGTGIRVSSGNNSETKKGRC